MEKSQDTAFDSIHLICKPEQSGKTFVMIDRIIKDIGSNTEKRIINIIFSDNNLLLTKQTSERIEQDLKKYITHNDNIYIEFSSSKRTKFNSKQQVLNSLLLCPNKENQINNIICCTNNYRIDDIIKLITHISNGMYTKDKFEFKIWIDEADKFTNYINNFLDLMKTYTNIELFCLTATPDKLFKNVNKINVLPLENTTSEFYHGWKDNIIHINDDYDKLGLFIKNILKINNKFIEPGTKWFIPAKNKKSSHTEVCSICLKYNMCVLIVNGDGLTLNIPKKEPIVFEKNKQLNENILDIYNEYNIHKYPFVITGNICISRGITITSKEFLFDYAILFNCYSKSELSQIAGRLKGNYKNLSNYKQPVVFTTSDFDKIATIQEKKSRKLAQLAYFKQKTEDTTIITNIEYFSIVKEKIYNVVKIDGDNCFPDYNTAKRYLQTKISDMNIKKLSASKILPIFKVKFKGQYYTTTSKLLKTGDKRINIEYNPEKDNSISEQQFNDYVITPNNKNNVSDGRCLSSTAKGSRYLILPINIIEDDEIVVVYETRHLKFYDL
jgi:hypothetical protein